MGLFKKFWQDWKVKKKIISYFWENRETPKNTWWTKVYLPVNRYEQKACFLILRSESDEICLSGCLYWISLISLFYTPPHHIYNGVRESPYNKKIHKEKQRGCPLLGANRYTHIYQLYMWIYIIYLFETIVSKAWPPSSVFL